MTEMKLINIIVTLCILSDSDGFDDYVVII